MQSMLKFALLVAFSLPAISVRDARGNMAPPLIHRRQPVDLEARLKRAGVLFKRAVDPLPPKLKRDVGAKSVDVYRTETGHVLIFVVRFQHIRALLTGRPKLLGWTTKGARPILHYSRDAIADTALLILGTETHKPLAPSTSKLMDRLQRAFASPEPSTGRPSAKQS
jgi:hypothetical protein